MSSIFKPNYQLRQSMASIPRPFIWGPGLQWIKWMTSIPHFVVWGHEFSIKKGMALHSTTCHLGIWIANN